MAAAFIGGVMSLSLSSLSSGHRIIISVSIQISAIYLAAYLYPAYQLAQRLSAISQLALWRNHRHQWQCISSSMAASSLQPLSAGS